ncbi:MAG: adenosine deaminase [Rhodospirillaceae bacterium]|nr:adenosine deaminase [Rhodospirillaceae bacterium]MBT7647329.1 adenosine deaminase [Rhodospirillaceae bacterium]
MPKGGDLHNHLTGAIYAESYIDWAVQDGLCVDATKLEILWCDDTEKLCKGDEPASSTCHIPDQVVLVSEAIANHTFYDRLIDGLSTRNYEIYDRSGHDQFFATFSAFHDAGHDRGSDMLVEVMRRAADQNILYLELMTSPGMSEARKLAADMASSDDLASMRSQFSDADLDQIIGLVENGLTEMEQAARKTMACDTAAAEPACDVTVRYLAQVIRVFPAPEVFSQVVYGMRLAQADNRVVGINLVAPEDDPVTLADYTKQMQAIGFAGAEMPDVGIALHAGELTLGLVPPKDLRFHIRQAVEIAGADRIGHGVDLMYEDDPYQLLALLAERDVMIEINLTSNAVILNVEGDRHPFPIYLGALVPTALSTDDEGVSRIDLTHEYLIAVETYDLSYQTIIKQLSYNSLIYAFAENRETLLAELDAHFAAFEAGIEAQIQGMH